MLELKQEKKIQIVKKTIEPLANYTQHSRVHLLKTFSTPNSQCYVKREDELSFSISGSKLRKYLSLIPRLLQLNITEAVVVGSAYSNHVLSLIQLLIENHIKPVAFLLGNANYEKIGNLLLTNLFIAKENIHWVSRDDWPNISNLVQAYCQKSAAGTFFVPEGALMPEALPGALTLALDILCNEQTMKISFSQIFIDAGSGLMAIATILMFTYLDRPILINVLLLADDATAFVTKLNEYKHHFEDLLKITLNWEKMLTKFKLYTPQQLRALGSTNQALFRYIHQLAQQEGILTDPIYSAKLFRETHRIMQQEPFTGNTLIVHSGGGLTLMGFQTQLRKYCLAS